VLERRAVALVSDGGRDVPVTADGRLLRGATPPQDLPTLGARVSDERGRQLLAMLGAAPDPLRRKARRAYLGPKGLTLAMRRGPTLYLGRAEDLRAKWTAAARVLADPTTEGARYIDVRIPERAAVGGLAPLTDPDAPPGDQPAPDALDAVPEIAPQVVPEQAPDVQAAPPAATSPSTGA
jgi:cell division protein FtsQ